MTAGQAAYEAYDPGGTLVEWRNLSENIRGAWEGSAQAAMLYDRHLGAVRESAPVKPDLSALLTQWQAILRLQDWDITVQYARSLEMGDSEGKIETTLPRKAALISILDPCDWQEPTVQDVEQTLVHELLHIHTAQWPSDGESACLAEEQGVDAIAGALIRLQRGLV